MKPHHSLLLVACAAFWLAGCKCCALGECTMGLVDDVTDGECALECLYHPECDLNRIGEPDWCSCWFNRFWCGCTRCGCNPTCPCCKELPYRPLLNATRRFERLCPPGFEFTAVPKGDAAYGEEVVDEKSESKDKRADDERSSDDPPVDAPAPLKPDGVKRLER